MEEIITDRIYYVITELIEIVQEQGNMEDPDTREIVKEALDLIGEDTDV